MERSFGGGVDLTADSFRLHRIGGGLCGASRKASLEVGLSEAPLEVGLEDGDDFIVTNKHERAADGAKYVGEISLKEGGSPLVPQDLSPAVNRAAVHLFSLAGHHHKAPAHSIEGVGHRHRTHGHRLGNGK